MPADNTWARAEALFDQALQLPESEWAAFARQQAGADPALLAEVERLLDAQRQMGSFLEIGVLDFRGQLFGAFRALEEIGRGGMSVVYSGERADGRFQQKVAIKVVLTQVGVAPETRILAALEHPQIARFLDGGTHPLGLRYLVMEYVEGTPVMAYAARLAEKDRLRLFLDICRGVQAAHRSLIVHRDLKPANILVDKSGAVKLLDFGIAKMLTPTGTQTVGPRAFTLDYASPEQILGQPASTSNDIYSLGVLLCELISGRLPLQLAGLGPDEALTQLRAGPPANLPLSGDLARIAAHALAADPASRYESAGALARDVERYLAGEPIEARPPSWSYRAAKFVARHRFAVSAVTLALVSLSAAALYAWRQAREADARFAQVRALSRSALFELHDAIQPLEGSETARRLISERARQYLDSLAQDSSVAGDVLLDVARGYARLAAIRPSEAANFAGQSAQAARRLAARQPQSPETWLALHDVWADLARLPAHASAQEFWREALAWSTQLAARDPARYRVLQDADRAALRSLQ